MTYYTYARHNIPLCHIGVVGGHCCVAVKAFPIKYNFRLCLGVVVVKFGLARALANVQALLDGRIVNMVIVQYSRFFDTRGPMGERSPYRFYIYIRHTKQTFSHKILVES